MRLAKVLGAIGRSMITAGVLVLLFVVYQLWGTGIATARAQNKLEDEFCRVLEEAQDEVEKTTTTPTTLPGQTTTSATLPVTTAPRLAEVPRPGEAAGRIEIEAIGVDWIFVQGVSVADLKKGPGHYEQTPMPGQEGNAAIAGHRTTYGAPFANVDKLKAGDEIRVTTAQGSFRYLVTEQQIVKPSQVEVLADKGDNRLTLTACHPKYTARERIIIVAELAGEPLPAPKQEVKLSSLDIGLSGETSSNWPAVVWGLVCAAIWLVAWFIGKKWRKWISYGAFVPFFLVALYFFFENFSRLLPSNY